MFKWKKRKRHEQELAFTNIMCYNDIKKTLRSVLNINLVQYSYQK